MFKFLAPLTNIFGVLNDLELASLDLIIFLLLVSQLAILLLFFFLLDFLYLVVFNLVAQLFHLGGSLFLLVPGHTIAEIAVVALGVAIGADFPGPATLVYSEDVLRVG